jgi:predicted FMN-binding regulatory protein PaiB
MEETSPAQPASSDTDVLVRIEKATARLEAANKRYEQNRQLAEAERVEKKLEGESEAGLSPVKKEETPQEYKNRVLRGEL